MKTRTIRAVAMTLGLVAVSAGVTYAGGGGEGIKGGGGELFQCYNISAPVKVDKTLKDVNDSFTNDTLVPVPGAPTVLCISSNASDVLDSKGDSRFNAFSAFDKPDAVLCYAPQVSNAIAAVTVTVRDPLNPGLRQTVKVNSTKYICVQAVMSDCPNCKPPLDPEVPPGP